VQDGSSRPAATDGKKNRHDLDSPALVPRRQKGRTRIEDRGKTIEARQPWLKFGMSRRTLYRRQAEKRESQG
jgi:hypothetical protein